MGTTRTDERGFLQGLGARLAEIRHDRGLTQEQIAEQARVDPQTIQRAETGRTALSLSRLRVVAGVLGIGLQDLFAGVGEAIPDPVVDPDEIRIISTWKKIPDDRRELALQVLNAFTGS